MKQTAVFMVVVFLLMGWVPGMAQAADKSYVIGRITGTYQNLPGYFSHNPDYLSSGQTDEVEFPGFRLLRVEDGKKFLIRPSHMGYFYQDLPGGRYTLTRKRNDRPDYRERKMIDIMSFEVGSGALVNLGTMNIILDGEPHESLLWGQHYTRGTYTYGYRYERDPGESGYSGPLKWFTEKKSKIAASFGDRVIRVSTAPTNEKDGSQVVLKEIVPRSER